MSARSAGAPASLLALLLVLTASVAHAGHADERQAAREIQFDQLRLLTGAELRFEGLGIHFGHVENESGPAGGLYRCGALGSSDAQAAAATVASALRRLPDAALTRLRLRYLVVCGGATAASQRIGGIPVPSLDLLILDGSDDSASIEHRALHELYHLLEYRFGGINDAEWQARFGEGYSNRYPGLLRKSPLGSGKAGFISAYGETHPHEDRAELFAHLLLSPRDVAELIRRSSDTVLRRKADYLGDKCHRLLGLQVGLPDM